MTPERRTLLFINLGHTYDHLIMLIMPTAVLGMGASFGMDYDRLIALAFGGYLAFGLFALPAGWLGDLWSRRAMMAIFFLGSGAAAIATGFARTPFELAAGLAVTGVFAAIYHPVGTAMLVSNAPRLGSAIGVNAVYGNLGIALAAMITAFLTARLGWRVAFVLPGMAGLALGAAFLLAVPREAGRRAASAKAGAPPVPRRVALRAFAVIGVATIGAGMASNVMMVGLPKLFELRLADLTGSLERIGLWVTGVLLVGSVAQYIIGRSIDRFGLRASFLPLTVLLFPALGLVAVLSGAPLIAATMAAVFGAMAQVTVNDTMVARFTSEQWRARAYAVRYVVAFSASATAAPLIALSFSRTGDFTVLYFGLAALAALVALAALFTPSEAQARGEGALRAAARVQPAE